VAHPPSVNAPSWIGNAYGVGASINQVVAAPISYAPTYAALSGGNQSRQGTAIQQVLSKQPQGDQKQLPDFTLPQICYPIPAALGDVFLDPTCGNINAIELITDKSPDFIFQNYIQTFAPLTANARPRNDVMTLTGPGNSTIINVTGPGQKLTITLEGWKSYLQNAFSVMTERFDPGEHTISAVTLQGHPLAGWRYWRVYSIGTNDVVIETGAYDQPAPGP